MNYSIVEGLFSVYYTVLEKQTNQEVYHTPEKKDAYYRLNFLNKGGAFDGWTPRFMLVKANLAPIDEVE